MNLSFYKTKKLIILILLFAGVIKTGTILAQSRETMVKAGYIEKFTHFVQWPQDYAGKALPDKFIVAVIGESPVCDVLPEIFSKSAGIKKEISIVKIFSVDEIDNCMILFISGSEKKNIDRILEYTAGKPILTISDSKGFGAKGVIINMFYEGNYIRYEVNRSSLNKSGLIINSMLLNYAVII